ncbi:hypothetical protein [Halalkalibacter alkalisediminis]|uniref:Glutamine amidotransferase type-2 domain-containing protein n=1 Tax=Halalkalibacter alkalisediminis TaxID=935616 RepID=A0ABV6NP33_9BACI|nr:hypothetical protein [Halalkalibacter alkalisediminis]
MASLVKLGDLGVSKIDSTTWSKAIEAIHHRGPDSTGPYGHSSFCDFINHLNKIMIK